MELILKVIWFLLPAGVSNMAPVFAAKLFPRFSLPVDLGKSLGGIRIFGDHKTYRGFISGIIAATVIFGLQVFLFGRFQFIRDISLFNYQNVPFLLGPWMGFSSLLGDSLKSFFKRRRKVPPGKSWFPFDQIDWILGTFALSWVFVPLNGELIVAGILCGLLLSMLARIIGYFLKINSEWI